MLDRGEGERRSKEELSVGLGWRSCNRVDQARRGGGGRWALRIGGHDGAGAVQYISLGLLSVRGWGGGEGISRGVICRR